jgi:hypothetical protein
LYFTFSQVGGEEVEKAEYSSSIPSSQLSSASAQSKEGRNTMVFPLFAQDKTTVRIDLN